MKTFLIVAAMMTLSLAGMAGNTGDGIQFFQGTWEEAKAKAKAENKLLFVDAYAVWCGPCKWMDANVFSDQKAGSFFNEHFISYKFDMEKGDGPAFARKYAIRAYPTLLFINGDGQEVHRTMGSRSVDTLIELGEEALAK